MRNVLLQWLFTSGRLVHKSPTVSRCTTWSRAGPKFKLLFPRASLSFVRPRVSLSFDQWHMTCSPPIRKRIWVGRYNNSRCYIARLSLNKMSTVIGWFLVTCPWSNSNVSRPGCNCAVAALTSRETSGPSGKKNLFPSEPYIKCILFVSAQGKKLPPWFV